MLKRDLIMIQFEELGKMIAQVTFNRNNNKTEESPQLLQAIYQSLKIESGCLMTTSLKDLIRQLDREDGGLLYRMELVAKTLLEESYLKPKEQQEMRNRARLLLEYVQQHDTTFSLERAGLLDQLK